MNEHTELARELLAKITPGPWTAVMETLAVWSGTTHLVADCTSEANAEFVAAAPSLVASLLADVDTLQEKYEARIAETAAGLRLYRDQEIAALVAERDLLKEALQRLQAKNDRQAATIGDVGAVARLNVELRRTLDLIGEQAHVARDLDEFVAFVHAVLEPVE